MRSMNRILREMNRGPGADSKKEAHHGCARSTLSIAIRGPGRTFLGWPVPFDAARAFGIAHPATYFRTPAAPPCSRLWTYTSDREPHARATRSVDALCIGRPGYRPGHRCWRSEEHTS